MDKSTNRFYRQTGPGPFNTRPAQRWGIFAVVMAFAAGFCLGYVSAMARFT